MPYVLEANRSVVETTLDQVAAYVGIDGGFDGFLERVLELRSGFSVPDDLVQLGVDAAATETIAAAAVLDPSSGGNPQPFTHDLAAAIFDNACAGRLEATA